MKHKQTGQLFRFFFNDETFPGTFILEHRCIGIFELLKALTLKRTYFYHNIISPPLATSDLWAKTGHLTHYHQNMFKLDNSSYYLKPMSCPFHHIYTKRYIRSYKQLPFRVSEMGRVFRYEESGALNGMLRCMHFTQDDAHIYLLETDIISELISILQDIITAYAYFGFQLKFYLSTSEHIDQRKILMHMAEALKAVGAEYQTAEGEGAFYAPKIDIGIIDGNNKEWQCGTVQVDTVSAIKFNLYVNDAHNNKVYPWIIHRAIFGSLERFTAILLEHYGVKLPYFIEPHIIHAVYNDAVIPIEVLPYYHCQRYIVWYEEDLKIQKHIAYIEKAHIPFLLISNSGDYTLYIRRTKTILTPHKPYLIRLRERIEWVLRHGLDI